MSFVKKQIFYIKKQLFYKNIFCKKAAFLHKNDARTVFLCNIYIDIYMVYKVQKGHI